MMGMQVAAPQLFYDFCLDDYVPGDHLLRRIDRFVDLESVRAELRPFYSTIGRPSIDPDLMLRMLIVGYCMGIRSERRLCEEVHLNLAYRWFCRLGLDARCRITSKQRVEDRRHRPGRLPCRARVSGDAPKWFHSDHGPLSRAPLSERHERTCRVDRRRWGYVEPARMGDGRRGTGNR